MKSKQSMKSLLSVFLVFLLLVSCVNIRTFASSVDEDIDEAIKSSNDIETRKGVEISDIIDDSSWLASESEIQAETSAETEAAALENIEPSKSDGGSVLLTEGEPEITVIASGECGYDLTWTVTSDGVLTISGTGEMTEYGTTDSTAAPWIAYKDSITKIVIEEGVTSVGKNAFRQKSTVFLNLVSIVTIPETLVKIGSNAFNKLTITTVYYGSSPNHWRVLLKNTGSNNDPLKNASNIVYAKENAAITGISVIGEYKVQYGIGEVFDQTGIIVLANEEGGTTLDVTSESSFSGFDSSNLGEVVMTVSYTGESDVFTTTFTVFIVGDDAIRASGSFGAGGDNLNWSLTFGGIMTITGVGKMNETWTNANAVPWHVYRNQIEKVVIADEVESVGSYAFAECYNLNCVEIGSSVKTIGTYAFRMDSALTQINLDKVVTISDYAFIQCTGLTVIDLGCAESIGKGAFGQCTNLETVSFGSTEIGDRAFSSCTKLKQADLNEVTSIGDLAFAGTSLISIDLTSATFVSHTAFSSLPTLTNVIIGAGLNDLYLPGSGITQITVPSTLTSFQFRDCKALESVTIEAGITAIPDYAFSSDIALTTVNLPLSISSIGDNAFSSCDALKTINFDGTRTQWDAIGYIPAEGVTVVCTDDVVIRIVKVSAIFDGLVRMKYYFEIPEGLRASNDYYVVFTKDDTEILRTPFSEGVSQDGQTAFYYSVIPQELGDDVTVKVVSERGSVFMLLSSSGTNYTESGFTCSPKEYAEIMADSGESAEMRALAVAFKDYGAAASIYFKEPGWEFSDAMSSVDITALESYKYETDGEKPVGISTTTITLMLEADNSIRIYYETEDGYQPENYDYEIDGKPAELRQRSTDGKYYLTVSNIPAAELGIPHTFSVSDGYDEFSIMVSALSYAQFLVNDTQESSNNLGKALYLYNVAAGDYFQD